MRTVSFGIPEGARDPLCDERDVMKKFNSHVKHCNTCYDNLSTWTSGRPLCARGHGYVLDMTPYFFCKNGKPYSMIDREKRDERNRVLVPSDYRHVTTFFEALDHGYSSGSSRPTTRPKVFIHQPTTQESQPRREHRRAPEPIIVPVERYGASQRSPRSPRHREERYHQEPRRGSLYYDDQRRRHHRDADILVAAPERYYR